MVRLKSKDEWVNEDAGIAFIFPKGGAASYISATVTQRLGPGEVLIWKREAGGKLYVSSGDEMVFWQFSVAF
jgi:hypothetical protein